MADDLALPFPEGGDDAIADTPRFWVPPDAPTSGEPTRSVGGAMGPALPEPPAVSAGSSMREAWRGNILGSINAAQDMRALRGERTLPVPMPVDPMGISGGLAGDPLVEPTPEQIADRKREAEDNFFAHMAAEHSPMSKGIGNFAGALVGSIASPESIGGLSSLLVRQFAKLAARPIITGSLDAAITTALGDTAAQGINVASGAQEEFEPGRVATSLAGGAVLGAGISHVLHGAGLDVLPRVSHGTPAATPEAVASGVELNPASTVPAQAELPNLGAVAQHVDAAIGRVLDGSSTPEAEIARVIGNETIGSPALKLGDQVYTGLNHGDAFLKGIEAGAPEYRLENATHGYVTSTGRFITNDEAYALTGARTSEQMAEAMPAAIGDETTTHLAVADGARARAELKTALDAGATQEEIANHPATQEALRAMGDIHPTDKHPGYGPHVDEPLPEWRATRQFTFPDEHVVGYDRAIEKLAEGARAFAGAPVEQNRQLFIVVGPPAAGKSTIAEEMARNMRAAIVDPDEAKKVLPEYAGGLGANAVHEESSVLGREVLFKLARDGDNIVLPKVGQNTGGIAKITDVARSIGYQVHIINMNVPPETAFQRMIGRFVSTGRIINPVYFNSIGDLPTRTYNSLKGDPRFASHAEVDGTAPKGVIQLTEGNGLARASLTPEPARSGRELDAQHPQGAGAGSAGPGAEGSSARVEPSLGSPAQTAALLGKRAESIAPHQVTDASGRKIDVAPIVVEARDLKASSDAGYDASLQPRNRDRAASQAQIRDIASNLDPERLGYSAEADRGAPIVGADGVIESGNGRVMALRSAYEANGEAAARYREWLAKQGVDVSAYEHPVLVRQNLTPMTAEERQAFTVAANQASTLTMSAPERAMADARLLSTEMLDLIRNPDDLGALANRDFTRAFLSKLPATEHGALADAHGMLSAEGLARARNAVLARAYGDSAIVARIAESTNDEVKSISNALTAAAPGWAKMRAEVAAGLVRADVDLTDELLEAVKRTADLRTKGTKLAEHLAQMDAFERLNPDVEGWMRMFYDPAGRRAAGAPRIAERLKFYAEEARKASADVGLDMGLAPIEARDIQKLASTKGQPSGTQTEGQGVFLRRRPGDGPGSEAGNGRSGAAGDGGEARGPGGGGHPGGADFGISVKDRGDGSFIVSTADGAGDLALHITPDAVRTSVASVSKSRRGEGMAVAMYERAVAFAAERGLPLRSDVSVSADALRVYEALKRRGYDVREAPNVNKFDRGWSTDDFTNKGWVFEVRPPAEPELNLRPKQQAVPNQIVKGRSLEDQGTTGGRVQRLEDLGRSIVQTIETAAREGRVTPGALGQFSTKTGVLRVRSMADLDTVIHEAGHALHLEPTNKAAFDRLITAHANELAPLGALNGPEGRAEAFAELFRLYAVNRAYAAREFPNATAALDTGLRAQFPKEAAALDALRTNLDAIHNAPSGELVTADTISSAPPRFTDGLKEALAADYDPSGRTVYSALDALYTATIDKLHPVYRAVSALTRIAADNGKVVNLLPADDAYLLARNSAGAHGGADAMLKHGVIPAGKFDSEGPSFAGALEKALGRKWDKVAFADFGSYLTARRMVFEYGRFFKGEIPNPPGKFSLADYTKAVADFEAKYPAFADAAQDIYQFQTNHLQRTFDKGLVSKEYFDAAMSRADYVPFVRDMADFAEVPGPGGGGAGGLLKFSVMKRFGGSQRSVVNPLESIFKRVHDLETVIARNDIVDALDRLAADAGQGAGAIAERIPSNQLTPHKVDVIEALKAAGKTAGVDEADLQHLILQAEDLLGDSTYANLFRAAPINEGGEPIVYGWRGGERYALRLADGRFGREVHNALTVMHDIERKWYVSILQISQMALRHGVVKAPDFILSNIIRDQGVAVLAAGRKYVPFISAMRGLGDIIADTDMAKKLPALQSLGDKDVARAYAGGGGLAGGAIVEAIEHSGFGKNVKSLQHGGILGKLGTVFEASEAGTRIGLYRSYMDQARSMGMDDYNAHLYGIFKSQDYVDFRKAGASMGVPRRIIPFLNAHIQGTDREVRALMDLPVLERKRFKGDTLSTMELDRLKDARVALVRTTSLAAIIGTGVALMNHEDPDYQSAPKYTRANNFLFKVGGYWFAIPKPFGVVQNMVNAFERATEYALRKDPALFTEWLHGAAEAFAPPTQNPLVGVLYDVPANYDRFRERPIVPFGLQGVKPSEQYTPYTSEIAKALAQGADKFGLDWSPMKIEYALKNMGASQAMNLLAAGDWFMGKDRPEKQIYDWPVLRRFMKNLERGSAATTAFYSLVGDKTGSYEQAKAAYQDKIRKGEIQAADAFLRNLPQDERIWTTMQALGFDAKEKRLHPMVNARDSVAIANGLVSQLNSNNLIREDDLDRQDLTRSRRAAEPIKLNASTRAKLMEDLQELSMLTARNAMVAVGAKGTVGLPILDQAPVLERLKAHSPEVAAELQARMEKKKIYDPAVVRELWPTVKERVLKDGENADVTDLAPRVPKHRKQRRAIDADAAE